MKLASACLVLLTALICPKPVDTQRVDPLGLMEPSFFDVIESPFDTLAGVMRREQDFFDKAMRSLRGSYLIPAGLSPTARSPHYEVLNNPDKFHVIVDIPKGMNTPSDVDVTYDERSNMLTVFGKQQVHDEDTGHYFSSQFSRSFSVDPSVEVDNFAATMDGGVLTISAPKNAGKAEISPSVRHIPVTTLLDLEDTARLPETEVTDVKRTPNNKHSPQENVGTSATDPFHIKERIEKARSRLSSQIHSNTDTSSNPNDVLENPVAKESGYKTSELRR